jgi:ribosomal protein S18 acetylase RimI-like enzyme
MKIRPMTPADYDAMLDLLRAMPGIVLREDDSREATASYLQRNPGMSFVAVEGGRVVGCVLGGHDGKRGYLRHLAVAADRRRRGLAAALVKAAVARLGHEGIALVQTFVVRGNEVGRRFWTNLGWARRDDVVMFSRAVSAVDGPANAAVGPNDQRET